MVMTDAFLSVKTSDSLVCNLFVEDFDYSIEGSGFNPLSISMPFKLKFGRT